MAEESLRETEYVEMSTPNDVPSRYRTRQTRGGKRRETTLIKQQIRSTPKEEEKQIQVPSAGQKYKISGDASSDESTVDENYEVDSIASSLEDILTWRGRMQHYLHSGWFHLIIVLLVVTDALIVIFELLLDVGAFGNIQCRGENSREQGIFCHFDTQGEECGPPAQLILERINISESPGSGLGEDGLCRCLFRHGKRVCADSDGGIGVNPAFVLHIASLVILTVFVLEIFVKLIAFRLKYFTHKFEVFDGCVVVLSYVLDWASVQEEEAFEAASLVIVLRLWRVVRIVNGAVLSAKSRADQQLSEARIQARTIVHAFHKAQDKLDVLEEENEKLKRQVELAKTAVYRPRGNTPRAYTDETQPLIVVQTVDKDNDQNGRADTREKTDITEPPDNAQQEEDSEERNEAREDPQPTIVVSEPEESTQI